MRKKEETEMAKRKQELIARVRYIKGKPEAERAGKWDDEEQFVIEIYDEETESWNFSSGVPLVHSKEFPQEEANFLHYSFIKEILRMLDMGYEIHEARCQS